MKRLRIMVGDVLEQLARLDDESVHCVVTSPPYWNLRDYGAPGQIGLEETPQEYVDVIVRVFREVRRVLREDCVLAGAPPMGVVLDPFAGSGTTAEVALRLGRRALMVEINPEYVALIEKRCEALQFPLIAEGGAA